MNDTRITNAWYDLRADIHGLAAIAADIEQMLGENLGPDRQNVTRAANALGAAIAALTTAAADLRRIADDCDSQYGFSSRCIHPAGHGGAHGNSHVTWTDAEAQESSDAIAASMGGRTD